MTTLRHTDNQVYFLKIAGIPQAALNQSCATLAALCGNAGPQIQVISSYLSRQELNFVPIVW